MINRSWSLKRIFPALIAILALSGLTAGSASALSVSPEKVNLTFSNGWVETNTANNIPIVCSGSAGSGQFTDGVNGYLQGELKGCKLGTTSITCTSAGSPSGVVKLEKLNTKLVYLDAAKTKFGLMLSPQPLKPVAEFVCWGFNVKWTGSVIGQIVEPALNVSSNKAALSFTGQNPYTQTYRQIEGAGPLYHLDQTFNGTTSEMALWGTENINFSTSVKFLP
jgi:hypothetical protein